MVAESFDFPDWHIDDKAIRTRSSRRLIVIAARYGKDPERCPTCGDRTALRAHGRKVTAFRDLPAEDGMAVRIEVTRRRYRCTSCLGTFLQPLPEMDGTLRMTHRLVRFIENEVSRQPLTAIAEAVGIHEKTVRRLVERYLPAFINRKSKVRNRSVNAPKSVLPSSATRPDAGIRGASSVDRPPQVPRPPIQYRAIE